MQSTMGTKSGDDRMRLFDCFCYCGEADLLEIRLEELEGLADVVVVVESRRTWKGAEKPLHFEAERARFARHAGRLRYVALDDISPEEVAAMMRLHRRKRPANEAWAREWAQRDAIWRGIADAAPGDMIMVSDVDEIPRREVIARILNDPGCGDCVWFLENREFSGKLNLATPRRDWVGSRLVARRRLVSPQRLRMARSEGHRRALRGTRTFDWWMRTWLDFRHPLRPRRLPDAGWHFTGVGSVAMIAAKAARILEDVSKFGDVTDQALITERLAQGLTYLGAPTELISLETMPLAIRRDPARFAHLLETAQRTRGAETP